MDHPPTQPVRPESGEGHSPDLSPPVADDLGHLMAFVRDRDICCPGCGYNLRNLVHPVCPECNEQLNLQVGLVRLRIGLFLAAVAPSLGSGFMAILLGAIMVRHPGAPNVVVVAEALLIGSGAVGLALLFLQRRFMRLSQERQFVLVAATWIVHIVGAMVLVWEVL